MQWVEDDGGATAAGYTGKDAGDCVARAIAIATRTPYPDVCLMIREEARRERPRKATEHRRGRSRSTPRSGVNKATCRRVMQRLGWKWTPTMQIGSGTTVHLRPEELPSGRLVVAVSKHWTAVIDGVIHDTHDPSRDGERCVYGYWRVD